MTPSSKRNITPELRSIPLTRFDCPYRWWEQELSIVKDIPLYSCQRWFLDIGCVFICETCIEAGKCPKGYPA